MLPTNVMSFMKKMVATDEAPAQSTTDTGGTFGKLKQTLSSSLLTAQDKVNKMSPRPSLVPTDGDSGLLYGTSSSESPTGQSNQNTNSNNNTINNSNNKSASSEPGRRAGACRVCLKSFKPDDYSKTCFECQQRVCEDCASYSKLDENEDANMWRCSVCRRKMASRVCIQQDSVDSCLDVPVLEALQRRHSDVKLGSTVNLSAGDSSGLAPPRSPELRRHSDVSPASLKELEKQLKGSKTPGNDVDWRKGGGRSMAPSRSSSPPRQFDPTSISIQPPSRMQSRRGSRVARQHSYDDDSKTGGPGGLNTVVDLGLGIPAMPRRKSAYDVFAPGVLQQAAAQIAPGVNMVRGPAADIQIQMGVAPGSRRPSFRVPHPVDDLPQHIPQKDDSPISPDKSSPILAVEENIRMRRRGSQLPDIAALRDRGAIPPTQLNPVPPPIAAFTGPNLEDLEAPRRQTSMDGEAIKIVIHDVDSGPICASKRRVILRKDPGDKAHRTRGFGMRVVGGKTGADGRLFAYIVWTVPGGPAEKGGLQQGDKILEWNGVSLIDRSFEEVCAIMDRTGDVVELLVEHATDFRMCDLFDENLPPGSGHLSGPRKSGDGPVGLGLVADSEVIADKSPSSPTRRKLPKTPEQLAREKQVSGRIQLQVWYHGERSELVVSLMAADDLAPRDEGYGHGNLPEAYAKVRILPKTGDGNVAQTEVSRPTQNPIWNATLTFGHITAENLMDRYIDIQLWDLVPHTESIFLGECNVELQKAFLEDRALWCRLEDPKGLRACSISKSANVSPRGSIVSGDVSRLIRRCDYTMQRSISDDVDSIGDGTSLLHPDHAYIAGSRRGSSQSEQLEVEIYQLGKDFSRSLPGSRRSSFQDREENKEDDMMPPASYMRDRRRSSVARRDPDEILKSLKAVRGELGRAMSLAGGEAKRTPSRRASRVGGSRKGSAVNIPEFFAIGVGIGLTATSPPSEDVINRKVIIPRWKGSGNIMINNRKQSIVNLRAASSVSNVNKIKPINSFNTIDPNIINQTRKYSTSSTIMPTTTKYIEQQQQQQQMPSVKLGPYQVQPKNYRLTTGRYGELKLGFFKNKGTVEVEVIAAKNIVPIDCDPPPDTYVKCYVKDGDRLRHKKKTRIVRHSGEPIYKQTLKYQSSDIFGRNLVIMVWQRCVGFEHNQGLGGSELNLDKITLQQHITGWYPLFPMHSFGNSDSDNSP